MNSSETINKYNYVLTFIVKNNSYSERKINLLSLEKENNITISIPESSHEQAVSYIEKFYVEINKIKFCISKSPFSFVEQQSRLINFLINENNNGTILEKRINPLDYKTSFQMLDNVVDIECKINLFGKKNRKEKDSIIVEVLPRTEIAILLNLNTIQTLE